MFTHLRERLHLKKVIRSKFPSSYQSVDWQQKKLPLVAVLIEANIFEDANFQRFLEKLQRHFQEVKVLGFVNQKEAPTQEAFLTFTKKEIDWLWQPKGKKLAQFQSREYDLLINVCQQRCLPLEYLSVVSKAHYKIGATTSYPNQYDLILKSNDFKSYLDQITFFLKKFKTDKPLLVSSLGA